MIAIAVAIGAAIIDVPSVLVFGGHVDSGSKITSHIRKNLGMNPNKKVGLE